MGALLSPLEVRLHRLEVLLYAGLTSAETTRTGGLDQDRTEARTLDESAIRQTSPPR